MKAIYAISGRQHCGKTETLKEVFSILKAYSGYNEIDYKKFNDDDFQAIFEIKKDNTALKISVITRGDKIKDIEKDLKLAEQKGCDIVFCACRNSNPQKQKIWDYYDEEKTSIMIIPKITNYSKHFPFEYLNRKEAECMLLMAELSLKK